MDNVNYNQFEDIEASQRIKQEIIDIGNGIYENKGQSDELFHKYREKEATENKQEWTNLSKKSYDIAKFNPYIKENYNKMLALDIYKEFSMKVRALCEIYTLSEDELTSNLEQIKSEMVKAFDEKGLEPAHYHEFLERLKEDCDFAFCIYSEKSADYMYNTLMEKHSEDLAYTLDKNLSAMQDKDLSAEQIKSFIKEKIIECEDLGFPSIDIFGIIISSIQKLILMKGDELSEEILISSLKDLKIGNIGISDIISDLESSIKNTMQYAIKEHAIMRERELDKENFISEQNRNLALKEFLGWYKSNKHAYPEDIDNTIYAIFEKYGNQEGSYLSAILERKSVLKNYLNLNPYVLSELERKSYNGTLNIDEIEAGLLQGFIGIGDGIRLVENMESDIKPEVMEFEMMVNDTDFSDSKSYMKRNLITIDLAKGNIELSEAEMRISKLKGETINNERFKFKYRNR